MTAWSHLPNAALIDEVLASVRTSPEEWTAAWDAARGTARDAAWDAARGAAWDAAWGAVAALVAYDDAGQFMNLSAEHLQRLYRIDPHPMFLLLQPAAIVFNS